MPGNADEIIAYWKRVSDQQFLAEGPFRKACEQKAQRGIRFRVHIVTAAGEHDLQNWQPRIVDFLSCYDFSTSLEEGVTYAAVSSSYFDDFDLIIVFPLSDEVQTLCAELAKQQSCASRLIVCVPEGDDGKLYSRLVREKYGVETVCLPRQQLLRNEQCRFGIDLVRHCANYLMNKVTTSLRQLRVQNTVVVMIHGIWTRALWQGEIRRVLEQAGLVAIPTSYKKFDILRFLLPFEFTKRKPVARVRAEIEAVRRRFSDGNVAIIAHSFGSYIFGKVLGEPEQRFDRVALCGSIIPGDFDFASAEGRFSEILNEVGSRDVWPTIAAKIAWGYGPTGSFGFNRGNYVRDRSHAGHRHNDFLNKDFCQRYWLPYFCDGIVVDTGDAAVHPSRCIRTIDSVPGSLAKLLFWGALGCGIAFVLWYGVVWFLGAVASL
jgi:pimeloyl-ACP methyl ester carboxylesterase